MKNNKKELKKEKDNKKQFNTKKQSTIFFVIIGIFILLILIGIIASKNLNAAFGTATYNIEFRGATDYNLYEHGKDAPRDGKCKTDEYGYLDPECAYKIACICGGWSKERSYVYDGNLCGQVPVDNPADISNSQLFTKKFTKDETYYCTSCSSASGCPTKPTTSCYVCDGGSGPVKTINTTRAATMTGVSDSSKCHTVADSECNPKPTTSCYVCDLGVGKEYANSTSSEGAAQITGGNNCQKVEDESKCKNPPISCYSCEGGNKQYQHATTVNEAKEKTGGNKCTIVEESKCEEPKPTTSCYSCKLGEGKEYVYSTSKEEAASKSGGTECTPVSNTNCDNTPKSCYACDTKDGKKYTNTTSKENAEKAIDGATNCTIVNSSQCEIVPDNPKTGVAGIVVAWVVGLSALAYSVIYFIKLRKIMN